jgi:hypothetical protein
LGLSVITAIIIIGTITVILRYLFGESILQTLIAVGSASTAIAIFIAILTLRDSHEWNRRQYTIEFLRDWNESTREHFIELELQFPEFFEVPDYINDPAMMESWCIDKNRSTEIIKEKSEKNIKLRDHLIRLLNYFEGIASAYEQHVVDRDEIEDSAATVILDFWVYFQPFIEEMRRVNRRDPWPPLSRIVDLWLNEELIQTRGRQAEEASRRYEETLRKLESKKSSSKLKKPTGI